MLPVGDFIFFKEPFRYLILNASFKTGWGNSELQIEQENFEQ